MVSTCCLCCAGYPPSVPLWYLRLVPAVLGGLLPAAVYHLMLEFKFSKWTAAVAAAVVIMGMEILLYVASLFVTGKILAIVDLLLIYCLLLPTLFKIM